MKDACPKCGKRHRTFPRACYYDAHSEHAHCVIAKLASLGTAQQSECALKAEEHWRRMDEYARLNFSGDIK